MNLQCTVSQPFNANYNPLYKSGGLKGHTGLDEVCGYGSDVKPYAGGKVIALWTPENPSPTDSYTAVYILCETELELAEHSIGHVSEILVKVGDIVTKDTVIAKEGNKGSVYVGGQKITLEMQRNGDRRGSHRHVQWRPVVRTPKFVANRHYLTSSTGFVRDEQGNYLAVYDHNNGYMGCVDIQAPLWPRNLFIGTSGYDVYLLQKALAKEGFYKYGEYTGYFGPVTMSAVIKAQRARGISPALGFFGVKSRAVYNELYKRIR